MQHNLSEQKQQARPLFPNFAAGQYFVENSLSRNALNSNANVGTTNEFPYQTQRRRNTTGPHLDAYPNSISQSTTTNQTQRGLYSQESSNIVEDYTQGVRRESISEKTRGRKQLT